jgi:formamidopyrimidine-DNA glycosylase
MPEYPEMINRAREMQQSLTGLTIEKVNILQEKCLNIPEAEFINQVCRKTFTGFSSHGKWVVARLGEDTLLINLGMGGEITYLQTPENLPEKKRIIFHFTDGSLLTINFWWFGYVHFVRKDALQAHKMFSSLGPDVMEISREDFYKLISSSKQRIKTLLLDQKKIAGIGNFYIQDILFKAGLHPLKAANLLTPEQIYTLYDCIRADLQNAADKGGAFYEQNLSGGKGNFQMEELLIAYKDGGICPVCQSEIKKIPTGSTTSYVCEHCQPL